MKAFLLPVVVSLLWIQSFESMGQISVESTIQFEDESTLITSSVIDCIDHQNGTAKQYISISVSNKLAQPISVSFKREMWYAGKCISCNSEGNEYNSTITINPNEEIKGVCGETKDLLVFFKMLNLKGVRQLSHFELKNINIQKL